MRGRALLSWGTLATAGWAPPVLCAFLTQKLSIWGFVCYFLNCFSPLFDLLDPLFILLVLCLSWSKCLIRKWNCSQTFDVPNPSLFRLHLALQFPASKAKIQFLLSRVQWHEHSGCGEAHRLWFTLRPAPPGDRLFAFVWISGSILPFAQAKRAIWVW